MNSLFFFIIVFPIIEILLLIKIGGLIGALNTVLLIFITAVVGVFFARIQGMNTLKSGFINIIGNPNVGKSTLMNCLVGEKLSIITSKAQTTRHRIIGIVNGDEFQLIFSDTPGIVKPSYELQNSMMDFEAVKFKFKLNLKILNGP